MKTYRIEGNTFTYLKTGKTIEFVSYEVAEGALVLTLADGETVVVTARRVENLPSSAVSAENTQKTAEEAPKKVVKSPTSSAKPRKTKQTAT